MIETSLMAMGPREFEMFRTLVHERTGIWLRDGKQVMLASRLSRRLRYHGIGSFAQYYEYVRHAQDNGDEIRELINCVTTNKTSFFRERHHFDFLAGTIVPQIRSGTPVGAPKHIRIWSAACSTGEEPYTIAITLLETVNSLQRPGVSGPRHSAAAPCSRPGKIASPGSWKIDVLASDIDTAVLDTARRAIYPGDSLASVEQPLRGKYFLRGKDDMRGRVKVKPEVTRLVKFIHLNLKDAHWPIDGLFDVIFFRNALIYFNQETQDIFLRRMARYLKPNGYLFLGNSEHVPWLHNLLEPLNQTMYRLRGGE